MAKSLVLFLLVFLYGAVDSIEENNEAPHVVTETEENFGNGPLPTGPSDGNGMYIPVFNDEISGEDKIEMPHVVTEIEENFGNGPLPTGPPDENGINIPVYNDKSVKVGDINGEEKRLYTIEDEPVDFVETNPFVLPDGTPLVEGDILLTPKQFGSLNSENIDRKAILPNFYYNGWNARWQPNANGDVVIPYRITASSIVDEAIIEKSLQHWMNHTCLTFARTNETGAFSHLYFSRENSGCYSYLGRIQSRGNPRGQLVSIGPNCDDFNVIIHEVGHAIGFAHEQSRNDRDQYVIVFHDNIKSGRANNFEIESKTSNYGVPYDYTSVMHYGKTLFSKDGNITLATKDPTKVNIIGKHNGLSFRDAKLANIIYNCTDKWLAKCNIATNPCKNEGYIGKDCKCVCRGGTSGTNCATVTRSYYAPPTCGGNVTTAGSINSPYFPGRHLTSLYCLWWIQAPECKKPNITFTAFNTYFRSSSGKCHVGGLEVKTQSLYFGQTYCGIGPSYDPLKQDIKPGDSFIGPGRDIVLDFYSRYIGAKTGFSATVSFVDQQNCKPTTAAGMTTMQPTTLQPNNPTMRPTMNPTTKNPTMRPTMYPTTMNPTMQPTMYPTTLRPTMRPTMRPTTMRPTMNATLYPTTYPPTTNPLPNPCPSVSIYSWGQCQLRNYGTIWIWKSSRNTGRYNCWLYVRSLICPRILEITYIYVPVRNRIMSCVANALMLGCRNRNRCCSINPRRKFARYRHFIPATGNFDLQEYSYRLRRNKFYIRIREITSSCHKRIILTPDSPSAIISSLYAGREWHCEWYVQAPPGKRIRMDFMRWTSTRACSIYRRIYELSLYIRGRYGRYLRRYWIKKCRRSMRRCSKGNGGLFIQRSGTYFYRYVQPLCSYWAPGPIYSFRNRLSISYQKLIKKRRLQYLYPSYFLAALSIY